MIKYNYKLNKIVILSIGRMVKMEVIAKLKEKIKKDDTWKIVKSKIESIPDVDKVELLEFNLISFEEFSGVDSHEFIYNIKMKRKRKPVRIKIIFTNGIINIEEL